MLLGRLVVDGPTGPRGSIKALLSPTLRRTTLLLWFIWYVDEYFLKFIIIYRILILYPVILGCRVPFVITV